MILTRKSKKYALPASADYLYFGDLPGRLFEKYLKSAYCKLLGHADY